MKIGVFDSGIGGLSVLNGLINVFSEQEYIYVADTMYSPYGIKPDEELIKRGCDIIKYFESQQVELIIIACNTMSVYLKELQKHTTIKILGVILPTVNYVYKTGIKEVGLIATNNTVKNMAYQNELSKLGIKTDALPSSFLVDIVNGDSNEEAGVAVKRRSSNNHFEELSHLILGCTHFNLVKEELKEAYPHITLVDTTYGIIEELVKLGLFKTNQINKHKLFIKTTSEVDNIQRLIVKHHLFENNLYEIGVEEI